MDQELGTQIGQERIPARPLSSISHDGDGDPRWRVTLGVMLVGQLFAMMGFSFVMPFIPLFIGELHVSGRMVPVWAGLTVMGSGITMSIVSPFWGYIADRRGRKSMVQRAMFGGAVVLASMGLVRNVYQLAVLRIIQGAVTGTVSACVALVSTVVPRDRLGASLGLMQMAVFMGQSAGPLLGGVVASHYGYRVPFGVTGALLLAGGLLVHFGATERFTPPALDGAGPAPSLRVLLRNPSVLGVLGVFLVLNVSTSFVGPVFPLFVKQIVGGEKQAASATGLLLAVTGVASALAAVTAGRLSDRVGHKGMLIVCTALTALLTFPHYWARTMLQLVVLRVLYGLAAGGMMPSMNAIVAGVAPRGSVGQAYGFATTASSLGWAIGPAIGGVAAAAFGYRLPFIAMGALMLLVAATEQRWISEGEKVHEERPADGSLTGRV